MVWNALKKSDDFVKIKSFKYIQDRSRVLKVLENYEKLMSNSEEVFP